MYVCVLLATICYSNVFSIYMNNLFQRIKVVDLTAEADATIHEVDACLNNNALSNSLKQLFKRLLVPRRIRDQAPLINAEGLVVKKSSYSRKGFDMGEGKLYTYALHYRLLYLMVSLLNRFIFPS